MKKNFKRLITGDFFEKLQEELKNTPEVGGVKMIKSRIMKRLFLECNGGDGNVHQNIWKVLTRWGIFSNSSSDYQTTYCFTHKEIKRIQDIVQTGQVRPRRKEILSKKEDLSFVEENRGIELTINTSHFTKDELINLLNGEIIQFKNNLYKLKTRDKIRVFSFWLNSERLNNLATVIIDNDDELEKEFQSLISQLR